MLSKRGLMWQFFKKESNTALQFSSKSARSTAPAKYVSMQPVAPIRYAGNILCRGLTCPLLFFIHDDALHFTLFV